MPSFDFPPLLLEFFSPDNSNTDMFVEYALRDKVPFLFFSDYDHPLIRVFLTVLSGFFEPDPCATSFFVF